jgi:hypothetical protein
MEDAKLPGMICISGCNPNGIKEHQLKSHLQHAMDLQVDIQLQKLCDGFGLVNIFKQVHPNQKKNKTYMRGSRTVDFALAPPELAH